MMKCINVGKGTPHTLCVIFIKEMPITSSKDVVSHTSFCCAHRLDICSFHLSGANLEMPEVPLQATVSLAVQGFQSDAFTHKRPWHKEA